MQPFWKPLDIREAKQFLTAIENNARLAKRALERHDTATAQTHLDLIEMEHQRCVAAFDKINQ